MRPRHVPFAFIAATAAIVPWAAFAGNGGTPGPVPFAYEASVCGPGPCYIDAGFTGQGWTTGYDCNFAAITPALLPNADGGTVTACGKTLTRVAVNYSTGGDAFDAGLLMKCTGTGGSGLPSVADGVYLSLSSVIPSFASTTPIEICAYILNPTSPGNTTGKYEVLSVDNFPLSTLTGVAESGSFFYRYLSGWTVQDEPSGVTTGFNDGTAPAGMNVQCIYYPNGVGLSLHAFEVAIYDGGLPPIGGEIPLNWQGMEGTSAVAYAQGPTANWNVFISCNGGSTTTAYYGRLWIGYHR